MKVIVWLWTKSTLLVRTCILCQSTDGWGGLWHLCSFSLFRYRYLILFIDLKDNLRECHVLDFNELCGFDDFDLNHKKKSQYSRVIVSLEMGRFFLCNLLHLCVSVSFCMTSLIALCKKTQCILERQAQQQQICDNFGGNKIRLENILNACLVIYMFYVQLSTWTW